jgi:hypothetical protein
MKLGRCGCLSIISTADYCHISRANDRLLPMMFTPSALPSGACTADVGDDADPARITVGDVLEPLSDETHAIVKLQKRP